MNLRLLSDAEMSELRGLFAEFRYSGDALQAAFGVASPPRSAALPGFLHATREAAALPALARVFLAGLTIPTALTGRVWPERLVSLCLETGMLTAEKDGLMPQVVIVPRGDLLFASDALRMLGSDDAAQFVLPASTHAAGYLLNLTIRRQVESTLDLGAGCGVQALTAAAHSRHVVATDVSPRALRFTEFNARLNRLGNVECLAGSLFAPVAGRRFDLVVSNPPFVPGPGGKFGYRDGGMELDSLCCQLVREAPGHLNEGGMLQMLCEWVEVGEEPWQERLASWLEGVGCDTWVLRSPPQPPATYAALRVAEIAGSPGTGEEYGEWLDYFAGHGVKAIHPGMLVLRRRTGRNWLQVQPLTSEPAGAAGQAILENLAACDFLGGCVRPADLLDAVLAPAPELELTYQQCREQSAWKFGPVRALRGGALPMDASLDAGSAALLCEFDGQATALECLQRLARRMGANAAEFTSSSLPVVRFFVERGLLLPP